MTANVRFERMRPGEIVAAREQSPLAYLPVGPLEWHGPHLPFGTDPLHAEEIAMGAVRRTGGVVLPTLYAGAETVVAPSGRPHSLANLGVPEDERVIGMDFPANSLKSLYFDESVFALTVREFVRGLITNEFRVIMLINGHGAANHVAALQRVAAEETIGSCRVVYHAPWSPPQPPPLPGGGHATRGETDVVLAFAPDLVDLAELPPDDTPITYPDYGIVDGPGFSGEPNAGYVVADEADPRRAIAEDGQIRLGHAVDAAVHVATRTLADLAGTD